MDVRTKLVTGGAGSTQRTASSASAAVAKRFEVILRSSMSSLVPRDDDLAVEMLPEKFLPPGLRAGAQVGERKGRNVLGAALEVERERVGHRLRDAIAGKRELSVGIDLRRAAERTGGELDRHRGHRLGVHQEHQRHSPHYLVGVSIDVECPDVLLPADRHALAGRRQDRLLAMLDFAEHELARTRRERERAQEVAVEAAQPRPQRVLPKRDFRLLNRRREDDVEADHPRAAVDHFGEYTADLAGPGHARRALERRTLVARFIEDDDYGGRRRRLVLLAGEAPAQSRQRVYGEPVQKGKGRRNGDDSGDQRDGKRDGRVATADVLHLGTVRGRQLSCCRISPFRHWFTAADGLSARLGATLR
jgi:hypothetical protein